MATRQNSEHYIDNATLLKELVTYQEKLKASKDAGLPAPKIPNTIGYAIERIAAGIASRPNFRSYTYIDEMTRDAIVDCVKAVRLFDIEKLGRKGKPNPFGYFSKIIWYAFLSRISNEKKKQKTKLAMMFDPTVESYDKMEGDRTNYDDGKSELLEFFYAGKV